MTKDLDIDRPVADAGKLAAENRVRLIPGLGYYATDSEARI